MKRITPILLIVCIAFSCGTAKFSASGEKEKKFVGSFLSYMDQGTGPNYLEMMKCISPAYIQSQGINKWDFKVDNIAIAGYSIERYDPKGLVKAKIWGTDRAWVHELTFQLRKEKGKIYLVPSASKDGYITPWSEKKDFIRE
jgi:hypothetical protein